MSKVALISGFPRQDACYLAEFLIEQNYEVHGIMKRYSVPNYSNIDFLNLREIGLTLHTGDVTDIGSLFDVVELTNPNEIYNLAAQSYVGSSWRLAHVTTQVDALGPLNFLEVIKRVNPKIKFYQAGTSEMFGNNNINGMQTEDTAFMPASPYGVAKLYGYHITRNFRESFGMFACAGILFNHESPLRGIEFVTRKVTDGVAQIYHGKNDTIKLGNLDAERDWGHAEDFVKAQWMMMQQDEPKDYIIATGIKKTIRDLCKVAFDAAGIDNWEKHVVSDPAFIRPNDLVSLHASSDKAKKELGWEPEWTFEKMIEDMVRKDIWRHSQ